MSAPKVSVFMPVYNTGKYIEKSIQSILNQTFSDFEFIIINDGSTDDSLDIIKKYSEIDSRIKFISRENKGIIFTRNEGLNISKGKYIALMDSDDVSYPSRLRLQYDFLEEHNEYVVVGSRIMLIDPDDDFICPMVDIFEHDDIDFGHINNVTSGAIVVNPTAMICRDSLIQVGGYHERYKNAEDIDVWLRLAEVGKLYNLNEILLNYRQHFDSIGYSYRGSQLKSIEYAITDACNRRGVNNPNIEDASPSKYIKRTNNDVYIKWGWWALSGDNIATTRKYAKKAILSNPFKFQAWKLLLCSIRGY